MSWKAKLLAASVVITPLAVWLFVWGVRMAGDEPAFVIAYFGMVANVAMAGAAVWAFTSWRKQISGQTRHDIAKRVGIAMQHLRWSTVVFFERWHTWRASEPPRAFSIAEPVRDFLSTVEEVRIVTMEVRAVWGDETSGLLQSVGDLCSIVATSVVSEVNSEPYAASLLRPLLEGGLPGMPGGRRRREIQDLISIIEDWAAPYIGREGKRPMSEDEIDERRWRAAGLTEEQVQEIVDMNRFARAAKKKGHTRDEIDALLRARALDARRPPTERETKPRPPNGDRTSA